MTVTMTACENPSPRYFCRNVVGTLAGKQILRAETVPVVGTAVGDSADLVTEGAAQTISRLAAMHVERNAVGRLFGTVRLQYPAVSVEREMLNVVLGDD